MDVLSHDNSWGLQDAAFINCVVVVTPGCAEWLHPKPTIALVVTAMQTGKRSSDRASKYGSSSDRFHTCTGSGVWKSRGAGSNLSTCLLRDILRRWEGVSWVGGGGVISGSISASLRKAGPEVNITAAASACSHIANPSQRKSSAAGDHATVLMWRRKPPYVGGIIVTKAHTLPGS